MTNSDEETLRFVTASFPSVWALELLLALKQAGGRCARSELVERLRASELVVSKALAALEAAGLVSSDGEGACYAPANKAVEVSVERSEDLYRRRPNAVCKAIVSANLSGATAFANAFRIRRERDD